VGDDQTIQLKKLVNAEHVRRKKIEAFKQTIKRGRLSEQPHTKQGKRRSPTNSNH
jgi:hypothetical protein